MRWLIQHRGLAPNDQPFGEISVASVDDAFLQSIQLSELYGFIGWLSIEKQNGPAARARRVSAIRTFFTYLQNKVKILETNVALELESPKKIKSLPRHLTLDQSMTLLDTVGSSDSEWSTRDYCIITFSELRNAPRRVVRHQFVLNQRGDADCYRKRRQRANDLPERCLSGCFDALPPRPQETRSRRSRCFVYQSARATDQP